MTVVASGEFDLKLSPQSAARLENDISGSTNRAATKASGQVSKSFQGAGAAISASFAAVGAFKVFGSFITEATEAAKVGRDTAAVIKSTGGVAGVTAKDIEGLATRLSNLAGVDDDLIQANLNVLATFTSIRNSGPDKIFDQAALAAQNLAARMGGDLQGATVQVGKALQDPIKGITALSRVGVSFTEDQKKVIKSLVETGDVAGAQKVILKELAVEFGGAAEANATDAAKLKVSMDNVKESLGTALLPIVKAVSDAFVNMSPGMQKLVVVGGLFVGLLVALAPALAIIGPIFAGITLAALGTVAIFVGVGVAIGLLVFLVVKHFDTIKAAIGTAFEFIKSTVSAGLSAVAGFFSAAWSGIQAGASAAFEAVKGIVTGAVNVIKGIVGGLGSAISGVWGGFVAAAKAAFNAIARVWNNTIGKISLKIPSWVPGIGGNKFDVPDIPTFHQGGQFRAPFGQSEGLAFLRDREVVFTPEQMRMLGGGGGATVHIYNPPSDAEATAFAVSARLGAMATR